MVPKDKNIYLHRKVCFWTSCLPKMSLLTKRLGHDLLWRHHAQPADRCWRSFYVNHQPAAFYLLCWIVWHAISSVIREEDCVEPEHLQCVLCTIVCLEEICKLHEVAAGLMAKWSNPAQWSLFLPIPIHLRCETPCAVDRVRATYPLHVWRAGIDYSQALLTTFN